MSNLSRRVSARVKRLWYRPLVFIMVKAFIVNLPRNILRLLDATLGKWLRHLMFMMVRTYYSLFYNVSCSGKNLLQNKPGTLILATHVSRHDGPLISAMLYTTHRIRPTVHYTEYYSWLQWLPMFIISAIPVSSPKKWPAARRQAHKDQTLDVFQKVLDNENSILLFPAGKIRTGPREIIAPNLSGVHEILRLEPNTPVMLLRIGGLGKFQDAEYDKFWTFLGRKKGRRHVSIDIQPLTDLDPALELAEFNVKLETLLNS